MYRGTAATSAMARTTTKTARLPPLHRPQLQARDRHRLTAQRLHGPLRHHSLSALHQGRKAHACCPVCASPFPSTSSETPLQAEALPYLLPEHDSTRPQTRWRQLPRLPRRVRPPRLHLYRHRGQCTRGRPLPPERPRPDTLLPRLHQAGQARPALRHLGGFQSLNLHHHLQRIYLYPHYSPASTSLHPTTLLPLPPYCSTSTSATAPSIAGPPPPTLLQGKTSKTAKNTTPHRPKLQAREHIVGQLRALMACCGTTPGPLCTKKSPAS